MPMPKGYRRTPDMTPEQYAAAETRLGLRVGELAARLGVKRWSLWAYRTNFRTVPDETAKVIRAMVDAAS